MNFGQLDRLAAQMIAGTIGANLGHLFSALEQAGVHAVGISEDGAGGYDSLMEDIKELYLYLTGYSDMSEYLQDTLVLELQKDMSRWN